MGNAFARVVGQVLDVDDNPILICVRATDSNR